MMQASVKMPFNEIVTQQVDGYGPEVTRQVIRFKEGKDYRSQLPVGYIEFKTFNDEWTSAVLEDGKEICFRNEDLFRLLAFFGKNKN